MVIDEEIILIVLRLVQISMSFSLYDHQDYHSLIYNDFSEVLELNNMAVVHLVIVNFIIQDLVYRHYFNFNVSLIINDEKKTRLIYLGNVLFIIKVYDVINNYYGVLSIYVFYCKGSERDWCRVIFMIRFIIYDLDQVKDLNVVFVLFVLFISQVFCFDDFIDLMYVIIKVDYLLLKIVILMVFIANVAKDLIHIFYGQGIVVFNKGDLV